MSENIKSICSDVITYRSNVKKRYNDPTNIAFISVASPVLEPFSFVGPKQLHQWLHFGMKYSTSLQVLMECFKANIMEEATSPQKVQKWNFFQEASLRAKWVGHCSPTEETLAFRKDAVITLVTTIILERSPLKYKIILAISGFISGAIANSRLISEKKWNTPLKYLIGVVSGCWQN